MIGQIIDERYHIETFIGRGGMGMVYRAADQIENRPVAIKMLHSELASGLTPSRFYREFRILTRIEHPRIVQAYSYGMYHDAPYLVLELLEGWTLKDDLARGRLPRTRLLRIAHQICDALAYLHAQSIIHRDLKPGNLMLLPPKESPQVKLMDFGLARLKEHSMQLTQDGSTLGTVAYMAPEQAQGLPIDFRADLYALGIILYEMATGRPPFAHENPATVLLQQITAPPPPPRLFNPELDEPLSRLILQLLSKDPAQRPDSTKLLGAQLAQLIDETISTLTPPPEQPQGIAHIPLIGREAALGELAQRWVAAQTGQGQVVMLPGAAGIGKTRLLTEMRVHAQIGADRWVYGRSREHGSLPYQPIIDVLDMLLPNLPDEARAAIPPELARVLPGMGHISDTAAPTDPAQARLRLFAACWELVRTAAKDGLVVAIEDAQWADAATLDLLSYLIQRAGQARILLVITYRPEEVEAGTSLDTLLRDVKRERSARTLALDGLTRDQVARFLRIALGWERVPDWLIDSFHQATGGNPLFIEETLKALSAEGQIGQCQQVESSYWSSVSQVGKMLQLPQSVLALAERRLRALDSAERAVLTAAAVLGPEFTFDLLQKVTGLDEDALIDQVDRLLAIRLIEELPVQGGQDRYRFAQESLRQALFGAISQRRRRQLHRRTGEAIEEIYDTKQRRYWPALAYHFAEAGCDAQALKYLILAGDAAAQIYANVEAIAYYTRALQIAAQCGAESAQLIHLYTHRGRSLELNAQFEQAMQNYVEMEKVGQDHGDRAMTLAAMIARVILYTTPTSLDDFELGETLAQRSLALARELGDRAAEAKALWTMLLARRYDDPQAAIAYGEQSLAIARELGLREQLAYTLNDLHFAYITNYQVERATAVTAEARNLWRELGNLPMLVDSLNVSAFDHYISGDYAQSLAFAEEGMAISHSTGNLWGEVLCRWMPGYIHFERGEPDRAIEAVETALRLMDQGGPKFSRGVCCADLSWIYGNLGDFGQAQEYMRQARAAAEHNSTALPQILGIATRLYIIEGDLAKAEATLQEAQANYDDKSFAWLAGFVVPFAACEVALARQEYTDAMAHADKIIGCSRRNNWRGFLGEALCLRGKALLHAGQIDKAWTVLTEARELAQAIGSRRLLWPILYALSQLETQRGNTAQADGFRNQAWEIIEYIAARISAPDLRAAFLAMPQAQAVRENA